MAINTTNIIGDIFLPDGTVIDKSFIIFRMTGYDTDADSDAVIVPKDIRAPIDALGAIDVDLWPNPDGVRGTFYKVSAELYNGVNPALIDLGKISVPATGGPFDINDLLPIAPPSGATVADYIAYLAAAVAGTEAAADSAEIDALAAAASAAEAALYDGVWLDDVDTVVSDTALTYTAAQPGTVVAGDYVQTRAEGFSYEVAASGATDEDITTDGGVKLYNASGINQWALVGRPSAVSVTPSGSGVLNGTYYWGVTFVTPNGETDMSNAASASPSSQSATVTIPIAPDRRVTARKIYRTTVGALEPQNAFLVATISDNTTTTYVDNTADGSLGAPAPHIDTSGGKILNGTEVIGAISGLATTFGSRAMPTGQGYACTAIGAYALEDNAGGYRNTAVGTDALRNNTTGANNTALGVHALDENTAGNDNAAFGLNALFYSQGSGNLAFGSNAAAVLATGDNNVYVGYTAGQLKAGGSGNTAVGALAAFAAGSGNQNTTIGSQAAQGLTNGNFMSVVGWGAGRQVTAGNFNTALGYRALDSCVTGSGNVAIGPQAGYWETDSNRLWIDNREHTDLADAKVKALVYGEFWVDRAGQKIDFNGQVNPLAGLGMPGRTVTADGAVTVDDTVLTCNKAGTLTLTLPTGKPDKVLIVRNLTANTVVSASANVQPIGGGADSTAILPATAGSWAFLRCRSSGTSWEIVMHG